MNTTILKVIVGSRMWGTATPASDTDYKEVIMAPLKDVLNPFKNHGKGVQKEDSGDDIAVYELMHFFRLCEKGNPTIMEVLFTPLRVETTPIGVDLIKMRSSWLDSKNIINAAGGMAKAQLMRAQRYLEDNPDDPRIGKLYVSTYLSMELAHHVLVNNGKGGDLEPAYHRELLIQAKQGRRHVYSELMSHIEATTLSLQFLESNMTHFKADKDVMADFCYHWYRKEDQ